MDHDALALALETLRRGSFAAVARDRNLEPSTVSRAVAHLERDLGFRLFQRSTRRLAPTEAGSLYLERAEALWDGLAAAQAEAQSLSAEPAGVLRLTASVAFGAVRLTPLLAEFRALYPKVGLDLVFTDDNVDLIESRIDLAVRLGPSYRADVIGSKLADTRYRVVAAPAYVIAEGAVRAPEQLARRRCLLFGLPGFRATWRFRDAAGAETTVAVGGDIVISSAFAVHAAAKAGLGPALLPDWLVDPDIRAGRLVDLLPAHAATPTDFTTAIWLLFPSRAYLPLKVRAMVEFLRGRMGRGEVGGGAGQPGDGELALSVISLRSLTPLP